VSDYRTDDSSFNSWLAWCERVSFAFFDSWFHDVGIKDSPVPKKKDTQDTEEILTRHFFWWKGCTHVFPQGERTHKHTWLSVAPPYIPNAVVPAPVLDWSRSKVYNLSLLNKGLEDGLRHTVWRAIFPARELYKNPSDETGTIKQYNLRWRHKEL
jgi:hypothetical protein